MVSTYNGSQPLYCQIPSACWHPQHPPPPPPPQQQPQPHQPSPPVAHFFPGYNYIGSTALAFGQTQLHLSPQQQPQPYRPYQDHGYESDKDSQLRHQLQPQDQQRQLVQLTTTTQHLLKAASPGGSTCDSARAESPAEAQLVAEAASDLAGFSLSGPRPVDMALSQKMEIVWHQRFVDFFSRFPTDTWHLLPVFDPPDTNNTGIARSQWRYFRDQAKVRFICTSCQKAWTSMGGQVVFWIYRDSARSTGYVHFKLYGQKCVDCCPEFYEHAIWYQEEVEKVIENLYHHAGQMFYGHQPQRRRVDRRAGQPRKEHNTVTCQACQENVCRMGQVLRKKMRTEA